MAARSVITTSDKKIAWYAPEKLYKSIASNLGLKVQKDAKGLDAYPSDGASGKLPRVRLNLVGGKSVLVFCAPNKVATVRKQLAGKTVNGKKIKSVSFPGS